MNTNGTSLASAALAACKVPTALDYPNALDVFLRFAESQQAQDTAKGRNARDKAAVTAGKAAQELATLLDRAQFDAMKAGWELRDNGQSIPTAG